MSPNKFLYKHFVERDKGEVTAKDVSKGFTISILLWTGFTICYRLSGTPLELSHTLSVSLGCALIGVILSYKFAHTQVNKTTPPHNRKIYKRWSPSTRKEVIKHGTNIQNIFDRS